MFDERNQELLIIEKALNSELDYHLEEESASNQP